MILLVCNHSNSDQSKVKCEKNAFDSAVYPYFASVIIKRVSAFSSMMTS